MIRTTYPPIKKFFINVKWALKMIFTIKRHCNNCVNLIFMPSSQKYKCLLFGSMCVEILGTTDCGDWRPR
jgi:hypothetical protein